jgi:transposase
MLSVDERETIRRGYYIEGKSQRQIAREMGCARETVKKALASAGPVEYRLSEARPAPVLGPYLERIEELLEENERLPHKQRYTGKRLYQVIGSEGYTGSESAVRRHVGARRRERRKKQVYLKLEFDPGQDAQVDWGEGEVIMAGEQLTVQLFVLRLRYSRRPFVKAYPSQRQECFFDGHVSAFHHLGGVPHQVAYDNLKTAVYEILTGRSRQEQDAFKLFRSHYLFGSRYCTPGQAHEKGGVEHEVGYARRNFLVPLPEVDSFEELNAYLLACCLAEDARTVQGQPRSIGQMWAEEQPHLLPLPDHDLPCCQTREVALTPYGQVVFETNRYSVPADRAYPALTLRAYPFEIEILHRGEVLARHLRCYGRDQDILDPLHYLPLLVERPGAFEHAQAIRRWRSDWPPVYEELLEALERRFEHTQAVKQFVQVLGLLRQVDPGLLEQAIGQALERRCPHLDGVRWCLEQLSHPLPAPPALDLSGHPHLAHLGQQPLDLSGYDRLLGGLHGD